MPSCPKCGEEIEELGCVQIRRGTCHLEDGLLEYDDEGHEVENQYKCLECGNILFTDEHAAIDFLKGE